MKHHSFPVYGTSGISVGFRYTYEGGNAVRDHAEFPKVYQTIAPRSRGMIKQSFVYESRKSKSCI